MVVKLLLSDAGVTEAVGWAKIQGISMTLFPSLRHVSLKRLVEQASSESDEKMTSKLVITSNLITFEAVV